MFSGRSSTAAPAAPTTASTSSATPFVASRGQTRAASLTSSLTLSRATLKIRLWCATRLARRDISVFPLHVTSSLCFGLTWSNSFSLQVLNANLPITALDVSTDGGQNWEETVRREYNFFERATGKSGGFSADRVMVRVSCSNGRRVILPEVSAAELVVTRAPTNC